MLNTTGYLAYTNVGTSMMPLIRQGLDIIEIKKKGEERFKRYDVVLYKRGSSYILHRILKVRNYDYVIVGDHCFQKEYVTDDRILGVLVGIVRGGKHIDVKNIRYRAYVHLWCDFYPVRAAILWIKYKLKNKK